MPRLQSEPTLLSEECLLQPESAVFARHQWWVMHTKPRAEKALARDLHEQQRHYFLPVLEKRKLLRGRVHTSFLPLFPGYLFLFGTQEDRLLALKTNRIVHCLEVKEQHELLTDLQRVYWLMQSGEAITPEDKLAPGDPVEIVHGALKGLTGTVLRRNHQLRLQVEVRLLQRGVSVEVESWMIEATGTLEQRPRVLMRA
ncbi:MAG TPA: transcription termination/antitermination NusG family protein [Gemmatales bacterium]|nr:transcription termination/antitermination NusG family protein [Gemmatales bacterium]